LLEVLQVESESLLRLKDEAAIIYDIVRTIQRDLDILESHIHTGSTENALRQHFWIHEVGVEFLRVGNLISTYKQAVMHKRSQAEVWLLTD
jgi:hypothetical protein